jgi:methionine-R-sulfoxide reductase
MKTYTTVSAFAALTLAAVTVAGLSIAADALQDSTNESTATDNGAAPPLPWNGKFIMPTEEQLRSRLTPLQYQVTQEEDTERPFSNEYWDNKAEGIYVDVVSGEPLFSSTDKFKSGTGWPSFTRPIADTALSTHTDTRFFMRRTELKSSMAGSHLGHLFDDGPEPTGQRYCINSASLRFVPKAELEAQGYAEYLSLFED